MGATTTAAREPASGSRPLGGRGLGPERLAIAREHVESGGLAAGVADTMQALATPSRVHILGRLRAGALSVNELAEAVGMEPSAVSHQLRLLRHLGFVVGRREGRRVVYDLYDDHVAHLLDEAVSHVEHLQLGLAGRTRQRDTTDVPA